MESSQLLGQDDTRRSMAPILLNFGGKAHGGVVPSEEDTTHCGAVTTKAYPHSHPPIVPTTMGDGGIAANQKRQHIVDETTQCNCRPAVPPLSQNRLLAD